LRTGAKDSLLKKVLDCQVYGFGPNDIWFDHSGQYLCTMYDNANIILDCMTGCVVGVYAGDFARGCLINGEYWISSEAGIRIMPFPYIEDIPARSTLFWYSRDNK
jgi:hypothetical protein